MSTKRMLALLTTAALSLTMLAGCGSNSTTSAASGAGSSAASSGAASSAAASSAPAESDLAYVQDKGKMVIGYTVYEPMNYTDADGNFTGFDTEFAEAVCEKLGVEPEFVEINWDTKVVELAAKSIDCIWNGMTITDELKEQISISDPYVKNMQVVVVKSDKAADYPDVESLAGASLVAEAGSAGQQVIESPDHPIEGEGVANPLSADQLTTVTKQTDALLEVASGASDAAILDWTLAKNMIGEGTDFADLTMLDLELSAEEYGIGFRKDSDLCTEVNNIMDELIADGTLPALAEKYGLGLAE